MLDGIWTALWTPTDEKGNLLKGALEKHLYFLFNHKIDGVVLCGSTGQFPYLSPAVRKDLIQFVIKCVGAKRVIVNISDISPTVVKELAQDCSHTDIAAIMLLPPFYYPFEQHDIAHYFLHMTQIAQRPLILYNFPECARNSIELETINEISRKIPIAGIKQSGSNFGYHVPLVEMGRRNLFKVFTGSDTKLPEALTIGVDGCIGGISNAIPELVVEVYHAFKKNKTVKTEANDRIKQIGEHLSKLCFPMNIAALMESRDLDPGSIKEVLSPATIAKYHQLVQTFRTL